jgi:hypothetical protein
MGRTKRPRFTPGPWASTGAGEIETIKRYKGDPLTVCHLDASQMSISEAEANAELIKAAPMLLHACQEALAWFDPDTDGFSCSELRQWEKDIREILTEAVKEAEAA